MSIKFKTITIRNFLSVGAVCQSINLERYDLTLVIGDNIDLGSDGARNGVGKTVVIQALSYALFGEGITNIRRDNLVNRTNGKGMLVTLEFSVNDINYKIERGRKPNLLRFYVDSELNSNEDNQAEGENKETQKSIDRVTNLSMNMFKHIIALNTYTEPFLALKAADQRTMIEQLLGITLLSEKAESLKEKMKGTKDSITKEDYRIKAGEDANKRVTEQIDAFKRRQNLWKIKHDEDLNKLVSEYDLLSSIDINAELTAHKELKEYLSVLEAFDRNESIKKLQLNWLKSRDMQISKLQSMLDSLNKIDIAAELQAHKDVVVYEKNLVQSNDRDNAMRRLTLEIDRETKNWSKLDTEIQTLNDHKCYACGQEFHDAKHASVLEQKKAALKECATILDTKHSEYATLEANPIYVGTKPSTYYKTEGEAFKHDAEVARILDQIRAKNDEKDPYIDQLVDIVDIPATMPTTYYKTESEAIKHSSRVDTLVTQIENKVAEVDPYGDQIAEMEVNALQTIDYTTMDDLKSILDHQKFLLDLLTNKDSFVRKRIIDQNLSFLNNRLTHYLESIGLPHQVVFNNDLSVNITELGREMDYFNLSRGEANRLILALSFAFRDVFESLYQPINIIFVDELMDSGMDTVGMENGVALLKSMSRDRNKSVWLISHRDELAGRVNSVLRVIKQNGFTEYVTE